ncbi:iron-containing alcohol dehydrogenase [Clostridiaceae bacterium OttesenSCG-928-D20]|nr:iron-containing alcohol dehydrogenase [Clostridiaceae bacterium OttesenSCG-928-D20]
MINFSYKSPTKIVFGKDSEEKIGNLIHAAGAKKILVHYGGESAKKSGILYRICDQLGAAKIEFFLLGGVVPNPRLSKVYEGIELCKKEGIDFILAVGGGSVIDSAKAIALGVKADFDVWELFKGERQAKESLPVASVLTIAAAGSETSSSMVITNEDGWIKKGYGTELSRPQFAIMNPELMYSLPQYQTMSGAVDILMHTMERYFTTTERPMEITMRISEAVLKTVMENAKILLDEPRNYEARAEVMWCGSLSHVGLTNLGATGGDWSTHDMEHELSGLFDVAHGAGLAAIWGSWARFVMHKMPARFARFARNVFDISENDDEKAAVLGIEAMEAFFKAVKMPTSIPELIGRPVSEKEIDVMSSKALLYDETIGELIELDKKAISEIYRMAN